MRKLIYGINLTLDGCCDHTKGIVPDDELYSYYIAHLNDSDAFLYGRKTYQLMVPFWPNMAKTQSGHSKGGNDYALAFEAVDKMVVVSKTLGTDKGKNTSIIRADLGEEVIKLKQQPGKNILTGGVDIPSQLIALGLVDEIHIVIHPVIAGEGRRLFDNLNLAEKLKLNLVDTKVFESGCVALHYVKS